MNGPKQWPPYVHGLCSLFPLGIWTQSWDLLLPALSGELMQTEAGKGICIFPSLLLGSSHCHGLPAAGWEAGGEKVREPSHSHRCVSKLSAISQVHTEWQDLTGNLYNLSSLRTPGVPPAIVYIAVRDDYMHGTHNYYAKVTINIISIMTTKEYLFCSNS